MKQIDGYMFVFSLLALIPAADRLGYVTEQISMHSTQSTAGLINATFGNFSELILSGVALRDRMYRVVQLSLLGSMESNLLLVLGLSATFGGLKVGHGRIQTFTTVSGSVNPALLLIATSGLAIPASLKMSGQLMDAKSELSFSRGAAIIMLGMYGAYLWFSLRTNLFEYEGGEEGVGRRKKVEDYKAPVERKNGGKDDGEINIMRLVETGSGKTNRRRKDSSEADDGGEDDIESANDTSPLFKTPTIRSNNSDSINGSTINVTESSSADSDEVVLTYALSLRWLLIITILISFLSDILVGTIEGFTDDLNINPVFVATVVVPILGNAAEHAASIVFAIKGKMDISIAICVGSCIQISLCVLPACVLMGWLTGRDFTLFFDGYETVTLLISVMVVSFFLQGGTSNWLAGVSMMGLYVMIGMGFWVHEKEEGEWGEAK